MKNSKLLLLIIWLKPFVKYLLTGYVILMLAVSSIPSLPVMKIHTEKKDIRLDYLMHFCEYALMAFLTFQTFSGKLFDISWKRNITIIICLSAFAILDEFHQKLIPGRTFNWIDTLSNLSGVVVAWLICVFLFRRINNALVNNTSRPQ